MRNNAVRPAQRRTRVGSFVAGLSTLASIWPAVSPNTRAPSRTDLEALRGDSARIGDDMRRVIDRERARVETAQR
jgi:hypothetical protein